MDTPRPRVAIFSDIHANLEALEEAVAYTKRLNVEKYTVLGDTVGYGANPNECFEWVIQNASLFILGNHEKALVDLAIVENFTDFAREAILWTRGIMNPSLVKLVPELPYLKIEQNVTFTHSSPDEPEEFRYLLSFQDARPSFKKMEGSICFVGHTHVPSCFCENAQTASYLGPGILSLTKGERYILNPGSVGQPRDRDPRLSFGIFDEEKQTFEIVRLPYDNQKAAQKIRQAGLPAYLADRLL